VRTSTDSSTGEVEGDYRNAESWFGDVADRGPFKQCWPGDAGLHHAISFMRRIESFRTTKVRYLAEVPQITGREIEGLAIGDEKSGTCMSEDATREWLERARSLERWWIRWLSEEKGGSNFEQPYITSRSICHRHC